MPPPELTYLNYEPLKKWLADKLNANRPWDEVVRELITATGKVDDVPAATFVGYHAADPTNLAGETSRIFLGQQIGCAQCHDHPFDRWKRAQFHELAAFFARTKSKLRKTTAAARSSQLADKGEYLMPDMEDPRKKGSQMRPRVARRRSAGQRPRATPSAGPELADLGHRARQPLVRQGADAIASGRGLWAAAFTSRSTTWAIRRRRSGPRCTTALAGHFAATGYDLKDLFRLIASSDAYRRGVRTADAADGRRRRPRRRCGCVATKCSRRWRSASSCRTSRRPRSNRPPRFAFRRRPRAPATWCNAAFGNDPSFGAGRRAADDVAGPVDDEQRAIAEADRRLARERHDAGQTAGQRADDAAAVPKLYRARAGPRGHARPKFRLALEHIQSGRRPRRGVRGLAVGPGQLGRIHDPAITRRHEVANRCSTNKRFSTSACRPTASSAAAASCRRAGRRQLGSAALRLGWHDLLVAKADELRAAGKSMILLWMDGGPSQYDTFNPKPGSQVSGPGPRDSHRASRRAGGRGLAANGCASSTRSP